MIRAMIGTIAVLAGFIVVERTVDAGRESVRERSSPLNRLERGRCVATASVATCTAVPRTAAAWCSFGDFQ